MEKEKPTVVTIEQINKAIEEDKININRPELSGEEYGAFMLNYIVGIATQAQRDADVEWYEARMQIILDTHYADYVRVDVQQARQVADQIIFMDK